MGNGVSSTVVGCVRFPCSDRCSATRSPTSPPTPDKGKSMHDSDGRSRSRRFYAWTQKRQALRAALLIQRWYRRHLARLEARRRCTWTIFQGLEYVGEQDQLKLYNFFNDMISHVLPGQEDVIIAPGNDAHHDQDEEEEEKTLLKTTDPALVEVENGYVGPKPNFPLTRQDLDDLLTAFRQRKLLHAHYVLRVLHEARQQLRLRPNIQQAFTALAGQITICGDLHGKLDDLLLIFYKNGLPGTENPYVFNGDFVDRGQYSLEVFVSLLACMLLWPGGMYLNRGNHEDHVMNVRYGFVREVSSKYKSNSSKILRLIEDVFAFLPLATVIDGQVLVVHGGISDTTDLNRVRALDRHRFLTMLRPPKRKREANDDSKKGNKKGEDAPIDKEDDHDWKQVLDLLWSDPRPQNGSVPNTFRGGGALFGPDVTAHVLARHGLRMLIRSHECKTDGFEFTHTNQCLTIFSASNYYEAGSNKGAYVKLVGKELLPSFAQYSATNSRRKLSVKQKLGRVEKSAFGMLREAIFASKTSLMTGFKQCDPTGSGVIGVADWSRVMGGVLAVDLPWRLLRDRLVRVDQPSNYVRYSSMFDDYELENAKMMSKEGPSLVEILYRNKTNLETIFRMMDKDNSGQVSMREFEDACHLLSKHSGTAIGLRESRDLAASIDINKDGVIDFNEFLEAFRLVDRGRGLGTIPPSPPTPSSLGSPLSPD